jgi:hypothetical protein
LKRGRLRISVKQLGSALFSLRRIGNRNGGREMRTRREKLLNERFSGAVIVEFRENVIGFDEIIVEKDGKKYALLVESLPEVESD